jgi:3-hydroxymyristoyl/3-hydroxydecanoyl-(acyl carrier protein) dehydratase
MDALTLPLDHAADRADSAPPLSVPARRSHHRVRGDKRIVGIKNVTLNERYLAHRDGELPVLPPTILTEAIAQVGAIMILAKPENRGRTPFFAGIERVRYRRPVHPATSSSSKRSSGACAAGWASCTASRASTARSRRRHDDLRARPGACRSGGSRTAFTAISTTPPIFAARDPHAAHRCSGDRSGSRPAPPGSGSHADVRLLPPQRVAMPRVSRSTVPVRANAAPA